MTAMPYVHDKPEAEKLANAKAAGQASFDAIRGMVEAYNAANEMVGDGGQEAFEDAERAIHEDPLSVEVCGGWYLPAGEAIDALQKTVEYRILLCTGGPAVQIVGMLNEYGEPETATMQVQDWFLPWTDFEPRYAGGHYTTDAESVQNTLLAYARCFYFGE